MPKLTIKQQVEAARDDLVAMESHAALTVWAKANGMDSRAGFSNFKKALLTIGVDYDAMRAGARAAKAADLHKKAAASLTLFSDAKARTGRFFENDRDYDGEQSSGEMAAAKKAVWLASKVKEALGVEAIALTLKVDAEWLTWANGDRQGGRARKLGEAARRLNVALTVEHIPGSENPADQYTVCSGLKKWSDNDLKALVQ